MFFRLVGKIKSNNNRNNIVHHRYSGSELFLYLLPLNWCLFLLLVFFFEQRTWQASSSPILKPRSGREGWIKSCVTSPNILDLIHLWLYSSTIRCIVGTCGAGIWSPENLERWCWEHVNDFTFWNATQPQRPPQWLHFSAFSWQHGPTHVATIGISER